MLVVEETFPAKARRYHRGSTITNKETPKFWWTKPFFGLKTATLPAHARAFPLFLVFWPLESNSSNYEITEMNVYENTR